MGFFSFPEIFWWFWPLSWMTSKFSKANRCLRWMTSKFSKVNRCEIIFWWPWPYSNWHHKTETCWYLILNLYLGVHKRLLFYIRIFQNVVQGPSGLQLLLVVFHDIILDLWIQSFTGQWGEGKDLHFSKFLMLWVLKFGTTVLYHDV